jgi:hypothetical protein
VTESIQHLHGQLVSRIRRDARALTLSRRLAHALLGAAVASSVGLIVGWMLQSIWPTLIAAGVGGAWMCVRTKRTSPIEWATTIDAQTRSREALSTAVSVAPEVANQIGVLIPAKRAIDASDSTLAATIAGLRNRMIQGGCGLVVVLTISWFTSTSSSSVASQQASNTVNSPDKTSQNEPANTASGREGFRDSQAKQNETTLVGMENSTDGASAEESREQRSANERGGQVGGQEGAQGGGEARSSKQGEQAGAISRVNLMPTKFGGEVESGSTGQGDVATMRLGESSVQGAAGDGFDVANPPTLKPGEFRDTQGNVVQSASIPLQYREQVRRFFAGEGRR